MNRHSVLLLGTEPRTSKGRSLPVIFAHASLVSQLVVPQLSRWHQDPPPPSHSHFITVPQRCQHCRKEGTYLSWRIINTKLREDLYHKVTMGKVFDNHCYYCGHYIPYIGTLFYCNPNRSEYLLFCPPLNEREKREIQGQISDYLESLPGEFRE